MNLKEMFDLFFVKEETVGGSLINMASKRRDVFKMFLLDGDQSQSEKLSFHLN